VATRSGDGTMGGDGLVADRSARNLLGLGGRTCAGSHNDLSIIFIIMQVRFFNQEVHAMNDVASNPA
jgi:hypothetical protein